MNLGIKLFLFLVLLHHAMGWKRSALIYNQPGRSVDAFKRHLMRIDSFGAYTGQWLFDAAILTADKVYGKDVYVADGWTGQDYVNYLNLVFGDASQLNTALSSLCGTYGLYPPTVPFQVSIGMPYLNPTNHNVNVYGTPYDFGDATSRLQFARWYVDEVNRRVNGSTWYNFKFGIYYHLEEAPDRNGDPDFLIAFNNYVHSVHMESVWVPFYDATHAFEGKSLLGFDKVSIQPRLSFLSSIDGGNLLGDRLYAAGIKAASIGQSIEYEIRTQGETELEYWLAHQYLAISQFTASSANPQVFFVGMNDTFDRLPNQASGVGFMWNAYQDLANYLGGQTIYNWEYGLPWPVDIDPLTKQGTWQLSGTFYQNLNAIRLDFNDYDSSNQWRGKLVVKVENDPKRSSFAVRVGPDSIDPTYNSVFVPLSNEHILPGTTLTIQIARDSTCSPWPNILRLVGSKLEPKYVVNAIYDEYSKSSNPIVQGNHTDSLLTHKAAGAGKLTDGHVSPTGVWWWDGVMGWNLNENEFSVTIDLGLPLVISSVRIYSYKDLGAGIQLPEKIGGFAGLNCGVQKRGTMDDPNCVPIASLGKVSTTLRKDPAGTNCYNATQTAAFGCTAITARYVTIVGQCRGWCLLDEIQVLDPAGNVVSTGKSYRVTPASGNYADGVSYGDNSQLLVDGAIFSDYMTNGKFNSVGLLLNDSSKYVDAHWANPRANVQNGTVWVTKANPAWGIDVPPYAAIYWGDQNNVLHFGGNVPFNLDCGGGCPCASFPIPQGSLVTELYAGFPTTGNWVMVTEISLS